MRALIDPRNNRVCQVAEDEFPVAEPLIWVDAPDGILPDVHAYADGRFLEPVPIVPAPDAASDSEKLATVIHWLAQQPNVPAEIKALNGQK